MSQSSSVCQADQAFLSLRMVTVDHYLAPPIQDLDPTYSSGRSHVVKRVPVLRIFGPTAGGQKTCLHLHGIFPYIYVPLPPSAPEGYAHKLALSLDKALNLSTNDTKNTSHVFKVQEVSGTPFYGYHPREHRFLKIFFYSPYMTKRAAEMLQNGGVMGASLQPHESHVPYVLQFMMDYNLQGMNFLHLSSAKFRQRPLSDEEMMEKLKNEQTQSMSLSSQDKDMWFDPSQLPKASKRLFNVDDLPESMLMDERVEPVSMSELEIDAVAADILNTNDVQGSEDSAGMNPGLQAIWEDERVRRSLLGVEEDLTPPSSPPRDERANRMTDSEAFWLQRFREKMEDIKQDSQRFVSETGESQSSDANATCNFFPSGQNSELLQEEEEDKERPYPAETPESLSLPSATFVDTHVPTLSHSILEASTRYRKRHRSSASLISDEEVANATPEAVYLDETIVDEEVVSQSIATELDRGVSELVFDEDDDELVELLAELGRRPGGERTKHDMSPSQSQSSKSSQIVLSQVSDKAKEKQEEEDEITLEMSQVWDPEEEKEDKDTKQSETKSASQDIWGDKSDSEDFWNNVALQNI